MNGKWNYELRMENNEREIILLITTSLVASRNHPAGQRGKSEAFRSNATPEAEARPRYLPAARLIQLTDCYKVTVNTYS
ncbi:MAG: hypothetical protein WC621_03185 [Patescibacteria group bacterium]